MRIVRAVLAVLLFPLSLSAEPLTFRHLAGPTSGGGFVDGGNARFSIPHGVAADFAGNVYVADTGNASIRRIAPDGTVSTLAGNGRSGYADGVGAAARFWNPRGVDLAPDGALIVADTSNARIRRVAMDGTVTTIAGTSRGTADGAPGVAQFLYPRAVAVDRAGTIYVADAHAVRRIDSTGVTTLAGRVDDAGRVDGPGITARFHQVSALTVGPDGMLYVADQWESLIRRVTLAGEVSTVISVPLQPTSLRFDAAGVLWIGGSGALYRLMPEGTLMPAPIQGDLEPWTFTGLAAHPFGGLVLADAQHHAIRRLSFSGSLTTLAGSPVVSGIVSGQGSAARFLSPFSLAADSHGNVLVSGGDGIRKVASSGFVTPVSTDYACLGLIVDASDRITCSVGTEIWQLTPFGSATRLAGRGLERGLVDGQGSDARFGNAHGIAADAQGNIYVADVANHVVRRIDANGVVTTHAGTATPGIQDGTRDTAQFVFPYDVAVDPSGTLYVLDNAGSRLRRVGPDGTVVTLPCAGVANCFPSALRFARDVDGVFYVSSRFEHVIYRVAPGGAVEIVGGLPGAPGNVDGRGDQARFDGPVGLAVTPDGRLVVAAGGSHTIHVATLPPVIDRFTAERTSAGTRLTWAAHYASGAVIEGVGGVPVSGSVVVTGNGPFRLTVTSEGGSVSDTASVGRRRATGTR